MLDFSRFTWLTFDCYGTLIDWEIGILRVLRPMLVAHGRRLPDEDILERYAALEAHGEAGEYISYREILEEVVRALGESLRFRPTEREVRSLAESLKDWKPFPDTVAALRELKRRYRLAIVSNIDDELFAATAVHLEVPFDAVITAQQARSYKPSLNNFRMALERIGQSGEKVLHVAQSLYHDVAPAKSLGLATVWVNRRAGKAGAGATAPSAAAPDLEVPDLKTLVERTL
jgi:2-haloacid dehalogenase